ncbi:MAG: cupin domain-containing protein [Rhodospirillales bacterium]|nr:cupin domain-containing protein [Rhodospirillales bacterium]
MINHHPSDELLLDYAAGTLPEALALAIATHASLCADCARAIRAFEAIGGEMLAEENPVECSDGALASVLARLDEAEPALAGWARQDRPVSDILPSPLIRYVGRNLDHLPWRRVGRLFEEFRLPLTAKDFKAALFRLAPGSLLPMHSHRGQEYTLVLAGGYRDGDAQFARGDFAAMDVNDQHQPMVDRGEPCLCLVVRDAPVKLSGPMGMFVNPFLRI